MSDTGRESALASTAEVIREARRDLDRAAARLSGRKSRSRFQPGTPDGTPTRYPASPCPPARQRVRSSWQWKPRDTGALPRGLGGFLRFGPPPAEEPPLAWAETPPHPCGHTTSRLPAARQVTGQGGAYGRDTAGGGLDSSGSHGGRHEALVGSARIFVGAASHRVGCRVAQRAARRNGAATDGSPTARVQ